MASGEEVGDPLIGYGAQQLDVGVQTQTSDQDAETGDVYPVRGQAASDGQSPALSRKPGQGCDQDVQPLAGDHVGDPEDAKRTRPSRSRSYLSLRDLRRQVITTGVGDDAGNAAPQQPLGCLAGGLAVEHRSIDRGEVLALH